MICLGITFLQHNPASQIREEGRGIPPPYQIFMILAKGTAIAESYASLVVDELTGVKITLRR